MKKYVSERFSLYGITARGKTAMGKRLFKVCTCLCVSPAEYTLHSMVNACCLCVMLLLRFDIIGIMARGRTAIGKRLLKVRPYYVYPVIALCSNRATSARGCSGDNVVHPIYQS
jgi:hypothetical protein